MKDKLKNLTSFLKKGEILKSMPDKLKNLTSFFKEGEILAIDLGEEVTRAVVVRIEGKKTTVLAAVEAKASLPPLGGLLREGAVSGSQIEGILEKLGSYPKKVVLVSPEVKFLAGELPLPANIKISSDKLREAMRWEAQAYLDFSASEGLFGYQLLTDADLIKEEFFSRADKTGKTTPVLITAISRDAYSQLAGICKRNHLSLQAVYPQEHVFAIDGFPKETTKVGSSYIPALEAALQQLKVMGAGKLGINDKTPLIPRLKSRIHILPLVVVGMFALIFLAHYAHMELSSRGYASRIEELETKRGELERGVATLRGLESQLRESQRRRYYLEEVLPIQRKVLLELFEGLIRGIPCQVVLERISQEGTDIFILEGEGISLSSTMAWVRDLGHLEVTQEARLETISKKRAEEIDLFRYQFRVRIVLN